MKTTDSSIGNRNNKWTCLIHLTFIILLVSLCVIIPVVSNTVSAIPYWAILILFLVPFAIYMSLLIISRKLSATTNVPVVDMEQDQDEITGLHQHIVLTEEQEDGNGEDDDDEGVPPSIDNTSYNPSTVGIPPSSFLAPTIHQQASIRSSSLEYTPPPPAYQDMMYPPSYRSTNSAKDDDVSVVY